MRCLARSVSGFERLGLRAPFVRLQPVLARRSPMATLRQPGRERARDDAEHRRNDHHRKQRRCDRERGVLARSERVERNDHVVMVGEGETEKDDCGEDEKANFQEANHPSLMLDPPRTRQSNPNRLF